MSKIENEAFAFCPSLREVTLPENLASIGASAFWGCNGLQSIRIPDGVKEIGDCAFYGCGSPAFINIPGSVKTFGLYAFDYTVTETVVYDTDDPVELSQDDYQYGSLFYSPIFRSAVLKMPQVGLEKARTIWPWCEFEHTDAYDSDEVAEIPTPQDYPIEIFTLSGIRIASDTDALSPGCYIIRKGDESHKILIK